MVKYCNMIAICEQKNNFDGLWKCKKLRIQNIQMDSFWECISFQTKCTSAYGLMTGLFFNGLNKLISLQLYHPLILNNAIADLFSMLVSNCHLLSNTFHCRLASYTCSYTVLGSLDQWILLFLVYSGHQWSFDNWYWHVWLFGWLWFSMYTRSLISSCDYKMSTDYIIVTHNTMSCACHYYNNNKNFL